VEKLCKDRGRPVRLLFTRNFFQRRRSRFTRNPVAARKLRTFFRLRAPMLSLESSESMSSRATSLRAARATRRTERANGRTYIVEVLPIGPDRWRARIAAQGGTNAVMPFYGTTPDEASDKLIGWLERAGPRVS